jgi:hypothetical protein
MICRRDAPRCPEWADPNGLSDRRPVLSRCRRLERRHLPRIFFRPFVPRSIRNEDAGRQRTMPALPVGDWLRGRGHRSEGGRRNENPKTLERLIKVLYSFARHRLQTAKWETPHFCGVSGTMSIGGA